MDLKVENLTLPNNLKVKQDAVFLKFEGESLLEAVLSYAFNGKTINGHSSMTNAMKDGRDEDDGNFEVYQYRNCQFYRVYTSENDRFENLDHVVVRQKTPEQRLELMEQIRSLWCELEFSYPVGNETRHELYRNRVEMVTFFHSIKNEE